MASDIRNNSPDETKYHQNIPGLPSGTMIPRAMDDVSRGFDHNRPGLVVIDPGEAGGGFTVDFSKIAQIKDRYNRDAKNPNARANVTEFFHKVKDTLEQKVAPPMQESDNSTNGFKPIPGLSKEAVDPVAQAARNEAILNQLQRELDQPPPQPAPPQFHYPDPRLPYIPPVQAAPPVQDLQLLPILLEKQNRQDQMMQALLQMMQANAAQAAKPTPAPAPEPAPAPVPEQPPAKASEVSNDLGLDFLEKEGMPTKEVIFEMANNGTIAARYHAVILGPGGLILVYDTRFKYGFQYLPPNLGPNASITVTIPSLNKSFPCGSLGLTWSLGCLDMVVLLYND